MSFTSDMIDPNNPTANAKLVFNDQFTSMPLSLTNPNGANGVWNTDYFYNTPNDPNAHNFLPSNGEQQWYVANTENNGLPSPFSTSSTNGLTIQATKTPSNLSGAAHGQPYLSGELNTHGTFSMQYGLYEASLQLPAGQGMWPAFWMLPENGQWPPELDMMESIGNPNQAVSTIHASSLQNGYENNGMYSVPGGFNTFAMDWEKDFTTFYVNGHQVYQAPTPGDINMPQYMLLNLAVGGNWPGDPNSSTQFPNNYNIKNVQVYQSNANLAAGFTPQGAAAYYGVNNGSGTGTGGHPGHPHASQTAAFSGTGSLGINNNYLNHGSSDLLAENTNGAVDVGEVNSNWQLHWTQVGALGPEWTILGGGDIFPGGQGTREQNQFFLENANGIVDYATVNNGHASYTQVGGLGPEWTYQGTGDYNADGTSSLLIKNTNGAVVVGEVSESSHKLTYTQVGAVGNEWSFVGSGDFMGNGHDQFLMENTNGTVVVGNVSNGHAQYTQVGALGMEWTFVGTGDYLGDGKSQFLIHNSNGAVDVGEVNNGHVTYTQLASIGSEWKFIGSGDYSGTGNTEFAVENTHGVIDIGQNTAGNHVVFHQVGAVGTEWHFH